MEKTYKRTKLSELPTVAKLDGVQEISDVLGWVEVQGIARSPIRSSDLSGGRSVLYSAILQDVEDPTFFAYINGETKDRNGWDKVKMMLSASSESGSPVLVQGESNI